MRLWDLESRTQIAELPHDAPVRVAAQSPDGRWLATITASSWTRIGQQPVRLWSLSTRQLVGVIATNDWPRELMQFSPDNRLLACEDQYKGIHLLNLETRQETALLPAGWNLIYPIGFAFAPQERSLAHCPDRSGVILLGDIASATNRSSLRGHTDMVTALAFSPDGRRLASGSMDRTLRLWDMRRRAETLTLTNQAKMIWSLVFSPDGQTLAVVDDTEQVKLLDAATGAVRNELRGHLDLGAAQK